MEPKFQTSFIPKKIAEDDSRNRVSISAETNIFTLAATVVFVVISLLYGGLFFYKGVIIKQVEKARQDLISASDAIQPDKIQEIIDNNTRINNSLEILDKHLATSRLMMFLSDSTIKKLKFNEFLYQNKDGVASVIIDSEVQTYNAFAYQQEVLAKSEYVKNPTFTDISLSDDGNVKFKFSGRIEQSLVSYKKALESTITINQ
ncbi:MAG TPA: hypothetical protein PLZ99_00495 [Parcubacteria group bacterium]|jgi:hypothetical protein|nr:hypothetical protein [Parcubacteria group bacterium]